jgi:hypothetical protein
MGLDFFGARYFSAAQGRFTSPDGSATPQPIPYADLKDCRASFCQVNKKESPLAKSLLIELGIRSSGLSKSGIAAAAA